MQKLYPRIENADLIIFGTLLYRYGPSAKMKLLIDRMRPYAVSGKLSRKKAAIVVPLQEGPKVCKPLVGMFRLVFDHLDIEFAGQLLPVAYEQGGIKGKQAFENAYELGRSLCNI